jgi:hypothetical protein
MSSVTKDMLHASHVLYGNSGLNFLRQLFGSCVFVYIGISKGGHQDHIFFFFLKVLALLDFFVASASIFGMSENSYRFEISTLNRIAALSK